MRTLIVRLSTSYFKSKNGIHCKKTIRPLKRLSSGYYDILEDEIDAIGVQEAVEKIENLYACADGIYELICCDCNYDWESGCLEEFNYTLIPYKKDVDNS